MPTIKSHKIEGVNIVNHDSIVFGDIIIENDKIKKILVKSKKEKKGSYYCIPAFIDQHTHGGYGVSFDNLLELKSSNLDRFFMNIKSEGVCQILPTTVTNKVDDIFSIGQFIFNNLKSDFIAGWHVEGPFISKIKKGAHNENYIIPISIDFIKKIKSSFTGKIIFTIAPEVEKNLLFIKKIVDNKTFISIGHTMADYDITSKAFEYGAIQVTHMFNAMKEFSYKNPGIVNYVLSNKKMAEIIADGVHVNNIVINDLYKNHTSKNLVLVSDSLSPKGLKDGEYKLGDIPIIKKKNHCYLTDNKTLSGSAMKYIDIVKNFYKTTKCSMMDIVNVTSYNASKNLSLKGYGSIKEKIKCNLLVVDDKLNIKENLITNK